MNSACTYLAVVSTAANMTKGITKKKNLANCRNMNCCVPGISRSYQLAVPIGALELPGGRACKEKIEKIASCESLTIDHCTTTLSIPH